MLFDDIFYVLVVIIICSLVQGTIGFGFSMLAVPLLALILSPVEAIGTNCIVAFVNCAAVWFFMRKKVEYRKVLPYILLSWCAVVAGVYCLKNLNSGVIMIALGSVIIVLTFFNRLARSPFVSGIVRQKWFGYAASLSSGFLGGAFSLPGPPMVAYFYNADSNHERAKANAQFFFTAIDVMLIPAFAVNGVINMDITLKSLVLIPVVVIFSRAGVALARRLSGGVLAAVINIFLIGLGLYLIVKNI